MFMPDKIVTSHIGPYLRMSFTVICVAIDQGQLVQFTVSSCGVWSVLVVVGSVVSCSNGRLCICYEAGDDSLFLIV